MDPSRLLFHVLQAIHKAGGHRYAAVGTGSEPFLKAFRKDILQHPASEKIITLHVQRRQWLAKGRNDEGSNRDVRHRLPMRSHVVHGGIAHLGLALFL